MGILVSRLNARLFIEAYGDGCFRVPVESLDDLATALQVRDVVVMGGLQPGQRSCSFFSFFLSFFLPLSPSLPPSLSLSIYIYLFLNFSFYFFHLFFLFTLGKWPCPRPDHPFPPSPPFISHSFFTSQYHSRCRISRGVCERTASDLWHWCGRCVHRWPPQRPHS